MCLPDTDVDDGFQTHPCGVEVEATDVEAVEGDLFQTHPCGVEVNPSLTPISATAVSDAPLWG